MPPRDRLWPLLAATALLACHGTLEPPPRDGDRPIQTDRLEYVLESTGERLRAEISSVYTNATGGTVHIVNCKGAFGVSLEKRVGGKWVRAWSNVVPLCLSSPIVVEPGRTHEHTLRVSAGRSSSNLHPRFEIEEVAGTYRMVWSGPVHPDGEGGAELPAEERISNAFVLEPR